MFERMEISLNSTDSDYYLDDDNPSIKQSLDSVWRNISNRVLFDEICPFYNGTDKLDCVIHKSCAELLIGLNTELQRKLPTLVTAKKNQFFITEISVQGALIGGYVFGVLCSIFVFGLFLACGSIGCTARKRIENRRRNTIEAGKCSKNTNYILNFVMLKICLNRHSTSYRNIY